MSFKAIVALLFISAAAASTLAVPVTICAVEYGMSACPHCLHLKETLTQMGIPFTFVDVNLNRTDAEEYVSLYGALVGGTYYVPFTIFVVNNSARLAVVGDRDAAELLRLFKAAVNATGLLLSATREDERWITDAQLIGFVNATVAHRAPQPAVIVLPATTVRGEVKLLTPFQTPLASADVLVSCPDGLQYRSSSDSSGRVQLICSEAKLTVLYWMGLQINRTVAAKLGAEVTVGGIGRLTIRVRGLLNQPISAARVGLVREKVELVGEVGPDGTITADLPEGSYTLTVSKGGKASSIEVRVVDGEFTEATLTMDVLWITNGFSIGLRELVAAACAVAAIVAAVVLLRRRTAVAKEVQKEGDSEG